MTTFDAADPSALAPAAWQALIAVSGAAWSTSLAPVAAVALDATTGVTRCPAERPEWVREFEPLAPDQAEAVAAFATQFSTDVSAFGKGAVAGLNEAFGPDVFTEVQVVYVQDFLPRTLAALGAVLATTCSLAAEPPDGFIKVWPALEGFMDAVIRIGALDPVTLEVVRLRGARQHDCQLCRSRRSREALDAGADEALFDAIDRAGEGGLSDRHQAAIALVDAMIWTPSAIPPEVVEGVREHFTPTEAVDLVLNVMRNAANKIAVALDADAPNVTEGVEIFAVRPV